MRLPKILSWLGRRGRAGDGSMSAGLDSFGPLGLPNMGRAPEFRGLTWLQGPDGSPAVPVTMAGLRGKPVLVHFWTYSCINCERAVPHVQAWHRKYAASGLRVIGIHAPEYAFEKDAANVLAAAKRMGLTYAIAQDNGFATWGAYGNRYWPAAYFIDADGNVRFQHFGEGAYAECETVIRSLLGLGDEDGAPARLAAESPNTGMTPETYLGFERSDYLGSPESVRLNVTQRFTAPSSYAAGLYYLVGTWELREGCAVPMEPGAALIYRVKAASAHLVAEADSPARIRVIIEGAADTEVSVHDGRSYPLFAFPGAPRERLLKLEFLDAGTRAHTISFE
jgi:thiol-disulfide isomerase/thioredoxin